MTERHVVTSLTLDEISGVDFPAQKHALVAIMKKGDSAGAVAAAIAKALADPPEDETPYERRQRELLKAAVELGTVDPMKVAAELSLDALAADLRKARPELTPEAAYVAVMGENPELAAIAAGS